MDDDKVEAVASSFFAVEYNSLSWESAPETIKDEFRLYARSAIALCARDQDHLEVPNIYREPREPQVKLYLH